MFKSKLIENLSLFCVILTTTILTGCRSIEKEPFAEPVFFPPLPEVPKLQFLTSFSGLGDFCAESTNSFERFVLGEQETIEGIAKPYGMALFAGKLYVCDVTKKMIVVFDLQNCTFSYLRAKGRQLTNPVNIFIDDEGWKYVADSTDGLVYVFDRYDNLINILGQNLEISPIDVAVNGLLCYVTDYLSNQVVVMNKVTGEEIMRIGQRKQKKVQIQPEADLPPGEFSLISDLAINQQGNIYVTDKASARITHFNSSGIFTRIIGRLGDNIDELVRPKGIAVDRENRIWVVDASTEVAKIYNEQGQLLLFFGLHGDEPGMMNLPATIVLDYDNVRFFQKYAVKGADIEFLVLVSNQYGPNKINVYGFGTFPTDKIMITKEEKSVLQKRSQRLLISEAGYFQPF